MNVKDIVIRNNEITASEGVPLYEKRGAVRLANCEKVKIDGLKLVDRRPNCSAAVEIFADTAADANGVEIAGLKAQLHESAIQVLDHRNKTGNDAKKDKSHES